MRQEPKLLLACVAVALVLAACRNPVRRNSGSGDPSPPVSVPPPQNLVGTVALDNEEPAVFTIAFAGGGSQSV
jgi:hypothetical protein